MKFKTLIVAATAATVALSTAAISGSHANKAAEGAIKARQAHMQLYSFNLGMLGAMAKGEVDYNADMASGAAANLAALATANQMAYWPPGSDMEAMGEDKTHALAKIWTADSQVMTKGMDLATAATALAGVAGNGLEALQGGIGPVGKSCGGCHMDYRKPK